MTEFLDGRQMWHFIETDLLAERVHDLDEFNCVPVAFSQIFFQKKDDEQLVLRVDLLEHFDE